MTLYDYKKEYVLKFPCCGKGNMSCCCRVIFLIISWFIIILIGIFVAMIAMQTIQVILKKKADDAKKQNEVSKEQLLEELKKEILEEELAKLKANNEIEKLEDELKEEVNTTIESEANNIEDDNKEEE